MVSDQSPWDRSLNLTAYGAVEAMSNYATDADLDRYRALLFEKSAPAAAFIADRLAARAPLSVVEFCSGSGRLLYSLERRGLLARGLGVEVSPSRHGFAEHWKAALGATKTTNIEQAAGDFTYPDGALDLVIMIDGALSYIYPSDPGLPARMLDDCAAHLAPGAALLLESAVMDAATRTYIEHHGAHRTYIAGDTKDPFSFALYETAPVDGPAGVYRNTSSYIDRATGDCSVKVELYKYYDAAELTALLEARGFRVSHYADFDGAPFTAAADMLVTLAVKGGIG